MKTAEKIVCICVGMYKINEGVDVENMTVCLKRIKNGKLNNKDEVVEKYKNLNEELGQNQFSLTAKAL